MGITYYVKENQQNIASQAILYTSSGMVNSSPFRENVESSDDSVEHSMKAMEDSRTLASNLGSFGSTRKEEEWRRTLASYLVEERRNVDGGEGMDMLWETYDYETESHMSLTKSNTKEGKKGGVPDYSDDDKDHIKDGNGQLCCLQALKFSAGKMNLGLGRAYLMKISKALKGIGWLHHVSRGKKVYH
ncbi:hypothetical protein FEM48_Zijuj09G0080600 [Ziziphus jujuba var. spinosa]|uniref:Uncharacterized protein n=1 Tax=Ziziphus jujuba var. spinosa TaxID=714518 RepID=A0A978URT5_ZIZJJ|nr:hypothetical protein FEM48_Zijuj09G0080600 [Ziziphus jujuba var. spinosa]